MIKKILAALLVLATVFAFSWRMGVRQRLANEAKLAQTRTSVPAATVSPAPSPIPLAAPEQQTAPEPPAEARNPVDLLKEPAKIHTSGQKKVCKKIFGLETCADTEWNIDVVTEGQPSVTRNGELFHVSLPLRFTGEAAASSEDFQSLKVDGRKFTGMVDAWADVGIDPADGCTINAVSTGIEWREKPEIELVGGLRVKVGDLVESHFEKALQEAVESLKLQATCEMVKQQIERLYPGSGN
ncbi:MULTISPECIES: DUF4403 family protein [Methylococcus]|uniref:DUF4403 family protein n=1 Tax=Methylococcus capsulatus TaxID=414 RepID=A0ABZ2F7M6_METCP|nr:MULTISPECIES: DUF4403 family protein [Methylococcus]MDF9392631.1 DUF4403 family protein [Methylococcus capsulatus]